MNVETLFVLSNILSFVGVVVTAVFGYSSWHFSSKISDLKDHENQLEIQTLKTKLNDAAADAKGFALGTGEVCVDPMIVGPNLVQLMMRNLSTKYPCLNIQLRWVNLDSQEDIVQQIQNPSYRTTIHEIFPSNGVFFFEVNMTAWERQRFNFFIRFKNNQGLTYQLIIAKVNGVIRFASRHQGEAVNKTDVPNDFPGLNPDNPDSLFQ